MLEKPELMERFDEIVTDRRLHRDELLAWIESRRRDELLHGAYRVMTTSGSSGRKGLFLYDPAGWASIAAQFLRCDDVVRVTPRLPRRRHGDRQRRLADAHERAGVGDAQARGPPRPAGCP